MPQNKDYRVISKIFEVLAESPEGLKSKRQVAIRVRGKYSTIFSYIDLLREHGFVSIEDVITERGNRPSVRVKLDLLGYLYVVYRISIKSLAPITANTIFRNTYQSLMNFLNKEAQILHGLFEADPWNKLCFFAMQKFTQERLGSKMAVIIIEEISKKIFMKYLGPEAILDIDYLDRIYRDETEICDLILKGIRNAHKKVFMATILTPEDLKIYLLTFGEAFDMLSEVEKRDVIIAFRYEYNNLIRHLIKSLPTEIKEKWENLMQQADLHQIACLFECPKCGHRGASLQDVDHLIRTYTVKCGKCGGESSLAYLAKYYDKQVEGTFEKYVDSSGAKFTRMPLRKLYEPNEDAQ